MSQLSFSDPQFQKAFDAYQAGQMTGSQVSFLVGKRVEHYYPEKKFITEAPEGKYYPDATALQEYNRKVVEYNKQIREYRQSIVNAIIRGELGIGSAPGRGPLPPGYLTSGYISQPGQDPDILYYEEKQPGAEPVRQVTDTRWPTSPSEELSEVSYDLPADARAMLSEGREPTAAEQLLQVARVPSTLVRGAETAVSRIRESLPKTAGAETLRQYLGLVEGVAGGAATMTDPLTFLMLPAAAQQAGAYLQEKQWNDIVADVNRSVEEYTSTRLAQPELAYRDVGFQIGGMVGFKALGRVTKSAYGSITSLPAEPIGTKGLAVIGGTGPIPFKQALQISRQLGTGISPEFIGSKGLAVIGGEGVSLPIKQLVEVALQKGRIPADILGTRGLAYFSGYTGVSTPIKQTAEVWIRRIDLKNLFQAVKEPAGGGLSAIGSSPSMYPLKQTFEVLWQKGRLPADLIGDKGLAIISGKGSELSLRALTRFLRMPGVVEPYTPRMPFIPKVAAGDISGFLQIVAKEHAAREAGKMEAFMKSTFKEPVIPTKGGALIQTDVRQLTTMGRQAGIGAVDVFPYVVLSYPPNILMTGPKVDMRLGLGLLPKSSQTFKQELKDIQMPDLAFKQVEGLRMKPLQELSMKQITVPDIGLKDITLPKLDIKITPITDLTLKQLEEPTMKQIQIPTLSLMMGQPPKSRVRVLQLTKKKKKKGKKKRKKGVYERRVDPLKDMFKSPKLPKVPNL